MFNLLKNSIKSVAPLSNEEIQRVISALKIRIVKRRKNIISEGEGANNIFYLNEGLARSYCFDSEGVEHTIDLIPQENWMGDIKSFLRHGDSEINIEALEDCSVFSLSSKDLNRFCHEIPLFERVVRKFSERYFLNALDRAHRVNRAGYSAQQRYLEFLKMYPDLNGRIPANQLASYLGVAPETLSRMRHQLLKPV